MSVEPAGELVLGAQQIERVVARLAHELAERVGGGSPGPALVGIRAGGVPFARRLGGHLAAILGMEVPLGFLDITMHRDDLPFLDRQPVVRVTEIEFDVTGRAVVLVDDVLFSGRTVRSAMDALMDLGRPSRILLAVLIDRGHRELPIQADVVGRRMGTEPGDVVEVRWASARGGEDGVWLIRNKGR